MAETNSSHPGGGVGTKICSVCKVCKPKTEYHLRSAATGRIECFCKSCSAAKSKARRLASIDAYREREKARKRESFDPKKQRARVNAYYAKNPEKRMAHNAVTKALSAGLLQRMPCEACGAEHALAHHPDYSMPLVVTWLCPPCHKATHQLGDELRARDALLATLPVKHESRDSACHSSHISLA